MTIPAWHPPGCSMTEPHVHCAGCNVLISVEGDFVAHCGACERQRPTPSTVEVGGAIRDVLVLDSGKGTANEGTRKIEVVIAWKPEGPPVDPCSSPGYEDYDMMILFQRSDGNIGIMAMKHTRETIKAVLARLVDKAEFFSTVDARQKPWSE